MLIFIFICLNKLELKPDLNLKAPAQHLNVAIPDKLICVNLLKNVYANGNL